MQPDVPAMGRWEAALGPLGPGVLRCVPEQVAPTGRAACPTLSPVWEEMCCMATNCLNQELRLHEKPRLMRPSKRSAPTDWQRVLPKKPGRCSHRAAGTAPSASCAQLPGRPVPAGSSTLQPTGTPPPCRGKAEWESTLKLTPRGVTSSGPITPQRKDPLRKGKWITCGLQAALKTSHVADFHEVSPHLFQSSGHGRHAAHSAAHTPPASREDLDVHRTAAAFTTGLPQRSLKLTSVVSQRFLNTL